MAEELAFERFDKKHHDRKDFDCGVAELNRFLRATLNQQMKRAVTVGYVQADETGRIHGYVTLSAGEIPIGVVPEGHGYPLKLPLPTTLIGRLAVDHREKGKGLGEALLIHALRIAAENAETIASAVIEVDVIGDVARGFYERFGFKSLVDDSLHMYLPMADVRALFRA